MKYVVSVSGGAGSTIAAHRAVEKHGIESVDLIFADTNSEDPGLYEIIEHMSKTLKPVIRLNDGRNIWDVFDQYGFIKTAHSGCKASLELKKKPLRHYMERKYTSDEGIWVTGLGYDEPERIERFNKVYDPYKCWHPLTEAPVLSHCQLVAEVERLGYPTQELYEKGYPHNNCGGECVLAGLSQWRGLLKDFPERFEYARQREKAFNEKHRQNKEPFTVLRDQSAKAIITEGTSCDLFGTVQNIAFERTVTPITLIEFEERISNNSIDTSRDFRSGCGCMVYEEPELNLH